MAHLPYSVPPRRGFGPRIGKSRPRVARIQQAPPNRLYRLSIEGRQSPWVAAWLDQGKPANLIELQRSSSLKNEFPRVIRPDLLITEGGLSVDGVGQRSGRHRIDRVALPDFRMARMGFNVLGGASGMLRGFASIFGEAKQVDIIVSEEAATYRPEMAWVAAQLGEDRFKIRDEKFTEIQEGGAAYRFFELFDTPNVPNAATLFEAAREKRIRLTPPPKPIFDEKMLFALLWNTQPARILASAELGEGFFNRMLRLVPYSWLWIRRPCRPRARFQN